MVNLPANPRISKSQQFTSSWPSLLALSALLLIYLWTLQTDVNGSSHDYLLDTGEIQVALNLWGTIHHTGYPHYTILSALLTQIIRLFGLSPAMAASVTSLIWSLMGLYFFNLLLCHIVQGNRIVSALATIVVGLTETFWMHSVITEVYSFSLLLVILGMAIGYSLYRNWHPPLWLYLVFILGMAVAHHRILILVLPMIGIFVWPDFWLWIKQHPRYSFYSFLTFLAPFLAYVYLPLRDWQGALWVYDQPQTWEGFWRQFAGNEVTGELLRLPQTYQMLTDNFHYLKAHLQLPWGILILGVIGLIWVSKDNFRAGLAFLYITAVFPLFVLLFPKAVWVSAVIMPSLLCVIIGIAYLAYLSTRIGKLGFFVSYASLLSFSAYLIFTNLPLVRQLTQEPAGRNVINLLKSIPDEAQFPGNEPVVAIPWGKDFFAAIYGLHVTQELSNLELVDHRANFKTLLDGKGSILTPGFYLAFWPPEWWQELIGGAKYNAITPGIVVISKHPPYQDVPLDIDFELGNGIRIRSMESSIIRRERVLLAIYWEATRQITQNYSVAIHLITRFPPQGPKDIISQADSLHPVQSWYPTTQWPVGEIILDQYDLNIPEGSNPSAVEITMYRVNDSGQFENSEWFVLPLKFDRIP